MEKLIEKVIERAIAIQQIPAPTFAEQKRAEYLRQAFEDEGLTKVEVDKYGNVFACLPGKSSDTSLVVSAHTDTVFPAETDLTIHKSEGRISGPGIGDNSVAVAGLFGLLWHLREEKITLPGDLWLVANVCEEGLGDLMGMRAVVKRFGNTPLAYLIVEGIAFGRIYHRGLGVRRYRITAETRGGHSWVDFGSPSAIHELAEVINHFLALRLPVRKRTSMNVGKINGGVSINTIAPKASLELDLRSESGRNLTQLSRKVERIVRYAERPGVHFSLEQIGDRPFGELPEDHPLVQLGLEVLSRQRAAGDLQIGSTDANIPLSMGYPAICIGLTNGGGAHTTDEFIYTEMLPKGLQQLVDLVTLGFERLGS